MEGLNLIQLFLYNDLLCPSCRKKLVKINKIVVIRDMPTYVLFEYNDFFEQCYTQYKDSGDTALAQIFQKPIQKVLKKYASYPIVVAPSNKKRLFHSTIYLLKTYNVLDIFTKTKNIKQSSQNKQQRHLIQKHIKLNQDITEKRVVFFDDVVTSGYTLKTCVELLQQNNIEVIPIVLSLHKNHSE